MKTNPTKSLSEMKTYQKKECAKKIEDARKKITEHLQLIQMCKKQAKPMPSFLATSSFFETLFEACEISLDALHGTQIELFTRLNPNQNAH
ncbi:hypothetical protein ACE193_23590 [Bernardetia sp. OM2101]|uniref:hypothetical protein n=1 Tax=Bernardetia sp. OM2101 TaxID=3344876 RepID=UPI0035CEC959